MSPTPYRSFPNPPRYSRWDLQRARVGEWVSAALEQALLMLAGAGAAVVVGLVVMLVLALLLGAVLGIFIGYTATMVWLLLCAGFGAGVAAVEGRDVWSAWVER